MSAATATLPAATVTDEQVRALLDMAPVGVFIADADGRYVYVNHSGARLLDWPADQIVGRSIVDFVHPAELDALAQSHDEMLDGGPHVADWRLRRRDGSWIWVEVTANILPGGLWQAYVRDITEHHDQARDQSKVLEDAQRDRAWLRAVIDTLPMAVGLHESDASMSFNRAAEEMLGIQLRGSAGSSQYAGLVFYPDGRPVAAADLPSRRALDRGEVTVAQDMLIRRPDGTTVPVLGSAAPLRDRQGRVTGAVSVFQDVSESMRLQRAVQDNERLLSQVFNLLPVGVSIADASGTIVDTNPQADAIWRGSPDGPVEGVRRAEWLETGEPVLRGSWPFERAAIHGETVERRLARLHCHDGSIRIVLKSAAPMRDAAGHLTGAIVVDEDITALYEAQQKLGESERLFRTVVELLPVGVWVADADGTITFGNAAAGRIWQGIRHVGPPQFGEYRGWWVSTGLPIEPDEWGITRAVRRGETSRSELIRIQCFDGSRRTVINWAAPIRADNGDIVGAVALNEDVTALYQTQEQLRSAVRDREHILAVVAHDLRSPLQNLMLHAQVAQREAKKADAAGARLVQSTSQLLALGRAMANLVDDLLAVSVDRAGGSMLQFAPVAPAALVRQAAEIAGPLYADRGLHLQVRAPDDLPAIRADAVRLLRVLANLLDNAAKFTDRGGRIVLEAQVSAASVQFSVANTGPPLREQERDRLFQPFWQAGHEDRRGAGLGLSICRTIVEAHGGSIWAAPAEHMRVKVQFLIPRAPAIMAIDSAA